MRICLCSPDEGSAPSPRGGGGGDGGVHKHVHYLAESLRSLGDEVEVVGPAGGLRGRRYDVIHVHEPLVPSSVSRYALWMSGARARVCTFHRHDEREATLQRLVRRALAPQLWWFQRGIAVSPWAARHAHVVWTRPLTIIPGGVDTTFYAPGPARPLRGERPGAARLLFVGRWTDGRKGLPVLLDAVARLRARHVDVSLDVVGRGEPGVPVPDGLQGVAFHGRVSESELLQRLRDCDILVAPSKAQGSFATVLVEAMAVGRPVVCSDIDSHREVASPEGALLAPARDPGALADHLELLCRDPERRRAMGQRNREEALRYDWTTLAGQVREEYERALRAPALGSLAGRRWTLHYVRSPVARDDREQPVEGPAASVSAKV